ncbi:hypothetical protein ABBQ32_012049 [Trebouxia sp. C0010 RCD-2024]
MMSKTGKLVRIAAGSTVRLLLTLWSTTRGADFGALSRVGWRARLRRHPCAQLPVSMDRPYEKGDCQGA